jgi:acetoacetyl-CoA synthetase
VSGVTDKPLWSPSPERIDAANITRFRRFIEFEYAVTLADHDALYDWSVENIEAFWVSVWRDGKVISSQVWDEVLVHGDRMPGAKWFPGARLNFAENLLRRRDDADALVFRGETGVMRRLTFAELHDRVARLATALRADGVVAGDRVVGFMPNLPETVVAMLAAVSIGAVWSSCSPDFGASGVIDRFGQIEPKVLFTADGYFYNGKTIDSLERVRDIAAQCPSIERLVVVPYVDEQPDLSILKDAVDFDVVDFDAYLGDGPGGEIDFAQLPFDHPLYIMYSSGTTGMPKCIVHGAGGTLLKNLCEHRLHTDVKADDKLFFFTTCGWMMWNWLVAGLAAEATIMLYDGSPFYPDGEVLWRYAEDEAISIFGTSAKYLAALEKAGLRPGDKHDLSAMRCLMSTGSPLAPEGFDYVYDAIKQDVCLSSISGGTDILGCFALGNPAGPVWRGEIQCRALGLKVEAYDDDGEPLVGQAGELVCSRPFPSMPVGFWRDADGARYHAAYFERYANVWRHGDWIELTGHNGIIIHGRSDATLNPGGVRIGTAEIYRQVEKIGAVIEAICVGQTWRHDVRVVLFVVLREGLTLDDDLRDAIRSEIRAHTTPRHVPAKIIQIAEIPRTLSGKIVELAVRDVIHGRPARNQDALANPQALALYEDLEELNIE